MKTIERLDRGLNLTAAGKVIMIVFGLLGLFMTGVVALRESTGARAIST